MGSQTASHAGIGGRKQVLGPGVWGRIYLAWVPQLAWCVTGAYRDQAKGYGNPCFG